MYNTHNVADRIKKRAKAIGCPVSTMLSELEMGVNALTQFSAGRVMSSFALARIADYLDCSVDYLLGRTDCPEVARNPAPATTPAIKVAAKGRGAHVIEVEPEQLKALKKALSELPLD